MKNFITALFFLIVMSSCSTITSISILDKGKLDIAQKEQYTIAYNANFAEGLPADISYTDEQGNLQILKNVTGTWEKHVVLKSGTKVKIKILASSKKKAKADFNVSVDGKSVSSYTFDGKRVNYGFKFELP